MLKIDEMLVIPDTRLTSAPLTTHPLYAAKRVGQRSEAGVSPATGWVSMQH